MPLNVKELIYVLIIAAVIFRLAKPIALLFMAADDFSRRRNVWITLTIVAFLSPSFWIFALIAIPILFVAGRKDSNPSALYLLLLHVIPPMDIPVPMVGMPYLFYINNYLLLSFCVMTPTAVRILRAKDALRMRGLQAMDLCLLGYGALTIVLFVHWQTDSGGLYPSTFTDTLRRTFVFFFSIFIPYFSITRSIVTRRTLLDNLGTFCLSCALLAAIAIFESARHWLLYGEIADRWGYAIKFSIYLMRGESLRAMASTGHSMALGHLLVVAFGFWLYLKTQINSKASRLAVTTLFWLGLIAAYSRGPWIAAVLVYFVFAVLQPRAISKVVKAVCVGAIAAVVVSFSPLGNKIVSVLPFLGGDVDTENIVYRQRLVERAWQIIQESPFFGDQSALLKMQDLRQGQGIIDLINTYVQVLLDNGFVGLSLFLSFILIALFRAWRMSKQIMPTDPDFSLLGTSLVSCIAGTLLLFANGSFAGGTERLFYCLAALATGYAYIGQSHRLNELNQVRNRDPIGSPR